MKRLILLFILSISTAQAASLNCGLFTAKGIIRETSDEFKLVVNENTQSEYIVHFLNEDLFKVAPYIDETVIVEFEIEHRPEEFKLLSKKILTIQSSMPSPLRARDTYLRNTKKLKCIETKI